MKSLAKEISNGFHFDPFPHFSPLSPHLYRHKKTQETTVLSRFLGNQSNRSDGIRTHDPFFPNEVR